MAKNGGYQIIDLGGVTNAAGGAGITIPGVYEKIEGTVKPLLVSGLVYSYTSSGTTVTKEVRDFYAVPSVSSGDFVIAIPNDSNYNLTIDDDDLVKVVTVED